MLFVERHLNKLLERFESPFYFYDLDRIVARAKEIQTLFSRSINVHFAMKANNNGSILRGLAEAGIGVDIVSGGELAQAVAAGFSPSKIVFSGVAKSKSEIEMAVNLGVAQINVESFPELDRLAQVAREFKRSQANLKVPVAIRINPNVDAKTHAYISTGFRNNKFGIDWESWEEVLLSLKKYQDVISPVGLAIHIGSQVTDVTAIESAILKILPMIADMNSQFGIEPSLDVGGGWAIDYGNGEEIPALAAFSRAIQSALSAGQNGLIESEIRIEPGRVVVGPFGWLVLKVEYVKTTPGKNFIICNGGMNTLLRPALYGAYHDIQVFSHGKIQKDRPTTKYDVVGPICESSDVLAKDRMLPVVQPGDFLVVGCAGAYGAVMSSLYNGYLFPREIVIAGDSIISEERAHANLLWALNQ